MQSLKRKTYFFISSVIILFLFFAVIFFYNNGSIKNTIIKNTESFFAITSIETIGRERSSKSDISKILKQYQKKSLLSLDLNYIQSDLEKVTWIKSVIIRRILPNKISLTIEEFSPQAIWVRGKDRFVLDKDGNAIERISNDQFQNYFTIKGTQADLNLMKLLEDLENFPEIYNQIDYANFIGRRRWDLHYQGGVRIMLPQDIVIDSLSILDTFI